MKTALKLAILSSILFPSALAARPHVVAQTLDKNSEVTASATSTQEAKTMLNQKKDGVKLQSTSKRNGELNVKQGVAAVGNKTATLSQDKDKIQSQSDQAQSSMESTSNEALEQSMSMASELRNTASSVASDMSSTVSSTRE